MEHEGDRYTNCGNKKTSRGHPDSSINKIGQNTKKIPGSLRRHDVTQTPARNHQLTLVWKTRKGGNNTLTHTWIKDP